MSKPKFDPDTANNVTFWLFTRRRTVDAAQELVDRFRDRAFHLLPANFPTRKSMHAYAIKLNATREQIDAIPTLFTEYVACRNKRLAGDGRLIGSLKEYDALYGPRQRVRS